MDTTDTQQTIQKLRDNAEEERKKKIRTIISHREMLLKELFTMTGEHTDESEGFMAFLKGADVTQIDQDKWNAYLDKYKLSNIKLFKEELISSPSEQPQQPLSPSVSPSRRVVSPPARMVTRGVSGAVRPKSVDEILSSLDQKDLMLSSPTKEKPSSPSSRHSQPTTPSTDRPLPSTSTVDQQLSSPAIPISNTIDPKTASSLVYNGIKLADANTSSKTSSIDLYAWQLKATHFPLYKQLQTARKTLTTHDWMLARDELKAVKTIQRIEALKKKNGWSLRQLKRHKAPPRAKTHWDS
ncbi:hypothetical protein CU097_000705, partial [Rhizopus azygosporus]